MKLRGADDTNRISRDTQVNRVSSSRNAALVDEMDRRLGYRKSPEVKRRALDDSRYGEKVRRSDNNNRRSRSPSDRRRHSRERRRERTPERQRESLKDRLGRKPIKDRIDMPSISQRLGRRSDVFDAATNKYDRNVDIEQPTNISRGYVDYDNPTVDEKVYVGMSRGGLRGRGRGRGAPRGRGRGRGGRGGGVRRNQSPPAADDLDRELDSYMKSTKGALDDELSSYMAAVPKKKTVDKKEDISK